MNVQTPARPGDIVVIRIDHENPPMNAFSKPTPWYEWGVHKVVEMDESGRVTRFRNLCDGKTYAVDESVKHMLVLSQDKIDVRRFEADMAKCHHPYFDNFQRMKNFLREYAA